MRFAKLFSKEFHECLPWMLLAAILFFAFGGFSLRIQGYDTNPNFEWNRSYTSPGEVIEVPRLVFPSPLKMVGPWLFCSSIGLGLILGIRQFWIPHLTRTWLFLLHRSVDRSTILIAKLVAALTLLVVAIGPVWIGLYWHTCRPELFIIPPTARTFIEGWIFIILGFVAYLGTALSGLSEAHWYTTKIVGFSFATIIIFTTTMLSSLGWAFIVIAFGIVLLLSQVFDTFLRREF
jgi:hypothetical protein